MSYKLESRQVGEISASFSYAEDTTLMAESEEELKSLLMRKKEKSEKASLMLNVQKNKIIQPHYFMANRCGNNGNSG